MLWLVGVIYHISDFTAMLSTAPGVEAIKVCNSCIAYECITQRTNRARGDETRMCER